MKRAPVAAVVPACLVVLLGALGLAACKGDGLDGARACQSDGDCALTNLAGVCRASPQGVLHWCALPSPSCDAGQRWATTAGDGLAGLCVGHEFVDMEFLRYDFALPVVDLGPVRDLAPRLDGAGAGAWTLVRAGGANLRAVWGSGAGDVYAVGDAGTLVRSDGKTWSAQTIASAQLFAVAGSGPDDVWVAGASGTLLHSTNRGLSWQPSGLVLKSSLFAAFGAAPGVYVGASDGTLIQITGRGSSMKLSTLSARSLVSVSGDALGRIFVGDGGGILHVSTDGGATFVQRPTGLGWNLQLQYSGGTLWAAPSSLSRSIDDGISWQTVPVPGQATANVFWSFGPDDVWVISRGVADRIQHTTDGGASWSFELLPTNVSSPAALWGPSQGDPYLVGTGGLILHRQ